MNGITELDKGSVVASVTLEEMMAGGERVVCWRGRWPDGSAGSVHALRPAATDRERQNFLRGARRYAAATRGRPLPGLATVAVVVPSALAYVTHLSVAGMVADLPILSWGVNDKVVLMQQLCRAMDRLHGVGISHGCLHPTNVLLDDDLAPVVSGAGTVLLGDSFGIDARAHHSYVPYAAQELRLGRAPSTRSDVFAIGRLLYFILHEEDPDEADEDLPLLAALAEQPAGLVRIIRRATVRDPDLRYLSVSEMSGDLERWEDEGGVGLRHPRGLESRARVSVRPGPSGSPRPISSAAPLPSSGPISPSRAPSFAPSDSGPPTPQLAARGANGARAENGEASDWGPPTPRSRRNGRRTPRRAAAQAAPPLTYAGPDTGTNDLLTEGQARAGGVVGAAILVGALAYAYWRAGTGPGVHLVAVLGAVGLSLFVPPLGRSAALTRLCAVLLFGSAAWLIDPTVPLAEAGRRGRYGAGNAAQRGARIRCARGRGVTDFGRLDLRETDFSGMDLSGVSFDDTLLAGSRFDGAQLKGASLRDADIVRCSFAGADLSGIDVSAALHWVRSRCDGSTTMPARWRCEDGKPVGSRRLRPIRVQRGSE